LSQKLDDPVVLGYGLVTVLENWFGDRRSIIRQVLMIEIPSTEAKLIGDKMGADRERGSRKIARKLFKDCGCGHET